MKKTISLIVIILCVLCAFSAYAADGGYFDEDGIFGVPVDGTTRLNRTYDQHTNLPRGVDLGVGKGTPVYAPFSGTLQYKVRSAIIGGKRSTVSYGYYLELSGTVDGEDFWFLLGHMDELPDGYPDDQVIRENDTDLCSQCLAAGNKIGRRSANCPHKNGYKDEPIGAPHQVLEGEYIGKTGDCGYSSGDHAHIEMKANGSRVDPNHLITCTVTASSQYNPSAATNSYLTNELVFNPEWYRHINSSDPAMKDMSDDQLRNHWLEHGIRLGYQGAPAFHPQTYIDSQDSGDPVSHYDRETAIEHFVKYGCSEGRISSVGYHPDDYKANYYDLQLAFGNDRIEYAKHYNTYGWKENRIANRRLKLNFNTRVAGMTIASRNMTQGAPFGTLPALNREGYTGKWQMKDKDGNTVDVTSTSTPWGPGDFEIFAVWEPNKYTLQVNGTLNGTSQTNTAGLGTFDVYINNTKVANDVSTYSQAIAFDSSYRIDDFRAADGKSYIGNTSYSGRIPARNQTVTLPFKTAVYTIFYDLNNGSGGPSPSTFEKTHGQIAKLSETIPTKEGFTFYGWRAILSDGSRKDYLAGGNFELDGKRQADDYYGLRGRRSIWAIWGKEVIYDTNCDDAVVTFSQTSFRKEENHPATIAEERPSCSRYKFMGWSTEPDGDVAYYPGDSFESNEITTLYAIWSDPNNSLNEGFGQTYPDGEYYIHPSNACLSGYLSVTNLGSAYKLTVDGTPTVWRLQYMKNGFYRIQVDGNHFLQAQQGIGSIGIGINNAIQEWTIGRDSIGIGVVLMSRTEQGSHILSCIGSGNGLRMVSSMSGDSSWVLVPSSKSTPITEGRYVLVSDLSENLELDTEGDTGEGTNIQIEQDTVPSQYNAFDVTKIGNTGYYKLTQVTTGRALSAEGQTTRLYQNVCLKAYSGGLEQAWIIRQQGNAYILINAYNGYCAEIYQRDAENQTDVRQYYYEGKNYQRWRFQPAEHTLSFYANAGMGAPAAQTKYYMNPIALGDLDQPIRYGYRFLGWSTNSSATVPEYLPDGVFSAEEDASLYAVWQRHNWGEAAYIWADDYSSVTAIRYSTTDPTYAESETVAASMISGTPATCTEDGDATYRSATFGNPAFETQTTETVLNATGHEWGESTYTWSQNCHVCTATRTCQTDETHVQIEAVNTQRDYTDPTCETDGAVVCTANFVSPGFITQEQTVTIASPGHSWTEPDYKWESNNRSITATRDCLMDETHHETETAAVVMDMIRRPEENKSGEAVYNAVFENNAFATQTKRIIIPALKNMSVLWLPSEIREIEGEAFANLACEAIIIPDSCTMIGSHAFKDCMELKYVRIPSGTGMAGDALEGCTNVVVDMVE